MVTRLEIAEQKLERLNKEFSDQKSPMAGAPFGQPIVMNSQGKRIARQLKRHQDRMFDRLHEIQEQEKRVERLRAKAERDEQGLTASGGLKKSVENLERWQYRVERLEFIRDYNKSHGLLVNTPYENERGNLEFYNAAKLKEAKETVKMLIILKEKSEQAENSMSDLTRKLIEKGQVNQWAKKPIYYFVKGLRKVALEIDEDGDFKVSERYPATSNKDREFLRNLGVNI